MSPDETSTSAGSGRLTIPRAILAAILAQADDEWPNECCGVLGGFADGRVCRRYALPNALASPVEFESEPRAMFAAVKDMRVNGWDILAVYHSHPSSPAMPSRTDLDRSYSPDVLNVIVSCRTNPPDVRAWRYAADGPQAVSFAVSDD